MDTTTVETDALLASVGELLREDGATVARFSDLISKVGSAIPAAQAFSQQQRAAMLDPLLAREEIGRARQEAEAAEVDTQRLTAAAQMLREKMADAIEREGRAAKVARYERVMARRDATAKLIVERYTELSAELSALCQTIMLTNHEVDQVNADLPEGYKPLDRPEGATRGFPDSGSYQTGASQTAFRITQAVLPSAQDPNGLAWPPAKSYALTVLNRGRGFSQTEVNRLFRS